LTELIRQYQALRGYVRAELRPVAEKVARLGVLHRQIARARQEWMAQFGPMHGPEVHGYTEDDPVGEASTMLAKTWRG
jgi:hypothetical protein